MLSRSTAVNRFIITLFQLNKIYFREIAAAISLFLGYYMKNKILSLFLTMLKIGAFTFGGGYAMIALLEQELVTKKKWIDNDEFFNMIAVSESTPGPIAINAATYVGYKISGFWGALAATLGVCIPSFIIIFIISLYLNTFLSIRLIAKAFKGIQVCVTFLIFISGIRLFKAIRKNVFSLTVFFASFITLILLNIFAVKFSSVYFILLSGFIGVLTYLIKRKDNKE